MNYNLYLEISPRATGKSDRLLLAVMQHIRDGGTAVVYTPSLAMGKHLYNRVLESFRVNDRLYFCGNGGDHIRALNLTDPGTRLFYDEFDHLDKDKVFWSTDGYYCTTAARIRKESEIDNIDHEALNDPLLCLLAKNDFVYERAERDPAHDKRRGLNGSIYSNDKEGVITKALEEDGLVFETTELLGELGQAETRKAYAAMMMEETDDSYDGDEYDLN